MQPSLTSQEPASSLSDRMAEASRLVDQAIRDTTTKINALPDNPKISRINASVIAFRMRSSDLGQDWTPFFHDWNAQYAVAKELLEAKNFSSLRDLLQGRRCVVKGNGSCAFAPEVIESLSTLIGLLGAEPQESRAKPTRGLAR